MVFHGGLLPVVIEWQSNAWEAVRYPNAVLVLEQLDRAFQAATAEAVVTRVVSAAALVGTVVPLIATTAVVVLPLVVTSPDKLPVVMVLLPFPTISCPEVAVEESVTTLDAKKPESPRTAPEASEYDGTSPEVTEVGVRV